MLNYIKKVSIVIPVYNRETLIMETICSATNQTFNNIEIIIVDNNSTDKTWEIIKEAAMSDSRIRVFQNDTNIGPVNNWSKCFDYAEGDYIKILWSDDLMVDTFIADAVSKMDSETAFVISGVQTFDSETNEVLWMSKYQLNEVYLTIDYLNDILMFNNKDFPSSPGCALFRANELKKAFIVDIPNTDNLDFKRYGAGNDLLLFLLPTVNYKLIRVLPYIGSFYREHKQSISVSNSTELALYYEWSKSFFINNYFPSIANQYKAKLFLKKSLSSKFINVYKASIGNINLLDIIKAYFEKIKAQS